jgi:hypothetical protein
LKRDLQNLVIRYAALADEEKEKGVMCFAHTPPRDDAECLVGKLWDCHLGPWREEPEPLSNEMRKLIEPALQELLSRLSAAPETDRAEIAGDLSNVGMIEVERRIRPQKGSFWQAPKAAGG